MGLVISHGGFDGGYAGFGAWRAIVMAAHGGSWPPHNYPVDRKWQMKDVPDGEFCMAPDCTDITHPGLFALFINPDTEGSISADNCMHLAEELEALLPAIKVFHRLLPGSGHIQAQGGFTGVTNNMIEACREAFENDEELVFC